MTTTYHFTKKFSCHNTHSTPDSTPTDLSSLGTQPTILYSLFFDIQRGVLLVTLKQVFNLPPRGKHKTMDSHVELYLLSHQHKVSKSKLVRNSLNPCFDEQFQLTEQSDMQILKKQTLIFKIFGYNKSVSLSLSLSLLLSLPLSLLIKLRPLLLSSDTLLRGSLVHEVP